MFRKIIKKAKLYDQNNKSRTLKDSKEARPLSKDLKVNLDYIKTVFEGASDIVIREFKLGAKQQIEAFLVMLDGLVDKMAVNESLLKSLMLEVRMAQGNEDINKDNAYIFIK